MSARGFVNGNDAHMFRQVNSALFWFPGPLGVPNMTGSETEAASYLKAKCILIHSEFQNHQGQMKYN